VVALSQRSHLVSHYRTPLNAPLGCVVTSSACTHAVYAAAASASSRC
jgi:hypothetical protein